MKQKVKENTMPENNGIYFSPEQLQDFMAKAMAAAVAEARKMTPMEERKYNEEVQREKRRLLMSVELAKAEEQIQRNKRLGCSHKCDPRTGLAVGRDRQDGEWTTGGQLHGNDLATLVCIRCAWTWRWVTNPNERDYINNVGMLHMSPPDQERVDEVSRVEAERDRLTMIRPDAVSV
jgi:hypothetical protein